MHPCTVLSSHVMCPQEAGSSGCRHTDVDIVSGQVAAAAVKRGQCQQQRSRDKPEEFRPVRRGWEGGQERTGGGGEPGECGTRRQGRRVPEGAT